MQPGAGERIERYKRHVAAALPEVAPKIVDLSRRIHAHPELAYEEHRAASWCRDLLQEHGFAVAPVPGVDTAFEATRAGGAPGPTVGFLAEYDALPEIGHGCGHNLIAGAAVGAALLLADLVADLPGTIRVYGCPAEEVGSGKVRMLEAGAFRGLDAALTFHAWHSTALMESCTGLRVFEFEFRGRPSHAATEPWAGASALDGVLLTYANVNALRQFVRDDVRMHGIITHGGDAYNVIPERASCRIGVRSVDEDELTRVSARVMACARAGALASDTTLEEREVVHLRSVRYNPPLGELVTANLRALGEPVGVWRAAASTDFGNVSQVVPAQLLAVATWPSDVAFHTHEAAQCSGRDRAQQAMLTGAHAMALTAIDVLVNTVAMDEMRANLNREAGAR